MIIKILFLSKESLQDFYKQILLQLSTSQFQRKLWKVKLSNTEDAYLPGESSHNTQG